MVTLFPMRFDADQAVLTITLRDSILPPGMVMLHKAVKRKFAQLGVHQSEIGIICNCLELDNTTDLISEWDVMLGRWDGRIWCSFALVVDPTISASALRARLSAPDVAVFHDVPSATAWLMKQRAHQC